MIEIGKYRSAYGRFENWAEIFPTGGIVSLQPFELLAMAHGTCESSFENIQGVQAQLCMDDWVRCIYYECLSDQRLTRLFHRSPGSHSFQSSLRIVWKPGRSLSRKFWTNSHFCDRVRDSLPQSAWSTHWSDDLDKYSTAQDFQPRTRQ